MSTRPVRTLAAAAVTALALVALAACNNDDSSSAGDSSSSSSDASSSATSSAATSSSAPTDAGGGSSAGAPQVTVLDAGSDPKEQLLLDVPEGQVETSTLDMRIGTSLGGGASTVKIPLTATYVTTVEDVSDDKITASFEFKDIEAHLPASAGGDAQDQVDQAFKSIEGLSGTIELTPSGAVTSTDFHLPADAPPELSSTIDQLAGQTSQVAVPFPDEPVGQGATWQVETQLGVAGVDTDQTATYTLDSIDGDDYAISVKIDQQIKGTSSGAGVSGTTSISGSYEGTLASFAATSGSLSGGGTSTVTVGGQTLDTKTTIDMDISTDVQ
ncbi:DUF6263 family protein [Nocardioides panacisoli]|uniref:LppX_LprAFG lipoprotein n=1 Tax=Nocardioides panacisoli TaxID=627624 RepID=A0ABP7I787_9ACTN